MDFWKKYEKKIKKIMIITIITKRKKMKLK